MHASMHTSMHMHTCTCTHAHAHMHTCTHAHMHMHNTCTTCQEKNRGVLLLSEFAGAAQALGAGALLINPYNTDEVAQALDQVPCLSYGGRISLHLLASP